MRIALVVVALTLATPFSALASADDLGGRQALLCANDLLEFLTELDQIPHTPTFHVGLATWFMGCTRYHPPAVGPVLSIMRTDIETLYRYQEELPDVHERHRAVVCRSWSAIYSSTYGWLLYEYGSDLVGDLPTPDVHQTACETWASGSTRGGR